LQGKFIGHLFDKALMPEKLQALEIEANPRRDIDPPYLFLAQEF
jgi:hypothetical protein